jgi:predicted ATPase
MPMIRQIRIQNYKSLGDVTVDLDPVTVLVGRSGTGKSNFVDAIRFLRDYVRGADSAIQSRGGWERIKPFSPQSNMTDFTARFSLHGIPEPFEYYLGFQWKQHTPQFSEERLSLGGKTLFHQQNGTWVTLPEIIGTGRPAGLGIRSISGVSEITIAYLVLSNGIGCYDFPGTVLQDNSGNRTGGDGLSDSASNFLHVAKGIVGNLQALRHWQEMVSALRVLNPSIKSLTLRMPEANQIVVSHELGQRSLTISLDQESEGFRRFLAHLFALYQTPPKQALVFEEPEKGVYAGALEGLAEQFRLCADSGRGQVILTSHSPQLLDHFRPEEIRVAEIRNGVTRIGLIAPEQVEAVREQLLRPGELLTVDPARLPGTLDDVPETANP